MENAKPTFGAQGVYFRSTIEAIWSYFLDELGWEWKYEPFILDIEGKQRYVPDFILRINGKEVLMEVKCDQRVDALIKYKKKIIDSGWQGEYLVCGGTLFTDNTCPGELSIGLMGSSVDELKHGGWGQMELEDNCAVLTMHDGCERKYGFMSSGGSWVCRACGVHLRERYGVGFGLVSLIDTTGHSTRLQTVIDMWHRSCDKVAGKFYRELSCERELSDIVSASKSQNTLTAFVTMYTNGLLRSQIIEDQISKNPDFVASAHKGAEIRARFAHAYYQAYYTAFVHEIEQGKQISQLKQDLINAWERCVGMSAVRDPRAVKIGMFAPVICRARTEAEIFAAHEAAAYAEYKAGHEQFLREANAVTTKYAQGPEWLHAQLGNAAGIIANHVHMIDNADDMLAYIVEYTLNNYGPFLKHVEKTPFAAEIAIDNLRRIADRTKSNASYWHDKLGKCRDVFSKAVRQGVVVNIIPEKWIFEMLDCCRMIRTELEHLFDALPVIHPGQLFLCGSDVKRHFNTCLAFLGSVVSCSDQKFCMKFTCI